MNACFVGRLLAGWLEWLGLAWLGFALLLACLLACLLASKQAINATQCALVSLSANACTEAELAHAREHVCEAACGAQKKRAPACENDKLNEKPSNQRWHSLPNCTSVRVRVCVRVRMWVCVRVCVCVRTSARFTFVCLCVFVCANVA